MRVSPDAGRNEQSWNSPSGFGQLLPRIEAALAEEPTRYQSWVYGFHFLFRRVAGPRAVRLPTSPVSAQRWVDFELMGEEIDHCAHPRRHVSAREIDRMKGQQLGLVGFQDHLGSAAGDLVRESECGNNRDAEPCQYPFTNGL